jgi:putative acetyltransferase
MSQASHAIRETAPHDEAAVKVLIDAAFSGSGEDELVAGLRKDGDVVLELIAEATDGSIAGHILFSRLDVRAGTRSLKAVALAPLAVRPDFQRRGIGQALTRTGIDRCRKAHQDLAVVLGHPDYYARFDFSALLAKLLEAPYAGPSFMALELRPGALDGRKWKVIYPRAFSRP